MSRYTADSRDRVRDAVDMLALVGSKVELTRRGHDSYFGCCPFHDERTASFHVRPDEKHYHCFGCSESGDPFDFVMQTEGLDFKGALESLADRFGVKLETEEESPEAAAARSRRERMYALLGRVTAYYERYFWEAGEAAAAREYMLGRGLSEEMLREFRVGYAPDSWERIVTSSRQAGFSAEELLGAGLAQRKRAEPSKLLDRFRGRIMFPTSDARGRVIGFGARIMVPRDREAKYVNTAEGEIYRKREVLYGIDHARAMAAREGRMILCEGYTDVIALHQAGVTNTVGIMGTSLTDEQVAELMRVVKVLELCLDADNAGQRAMERAAKVCADSGLELRVVPLPVGADPGELIAREGADALRERIADSVPYVVFQVGRVLAASDLSGAEGKDRAIAALRPVMATVPETPSRDDLMKTIARRLDLRPARLQMLLGQESSAPAESHTYRARDLPVAPVRDNTGRSTSVKGPQPDRDFLLACLEVPTLGAKALATLHPDALPLDDVLRRVARMMVERLQSGLKELPTDDSEALAMLEFLQLRADERIARRGRPLSSDEIDYARLLLERQRLQRELKHARAYGGSGLKTLSLELQKVEGSMRVLTPRIEALSQA